MRDSPRLDLNSVPSRGPWINSQPTSRFRALAEFSPSIASIPASSMLPCFAKTFNSSAIARRVARLPSFDSSQNRIFRIFVTPCSYSKHPQFHPYFTTHFASTTQGRRTLFASPPNPSARIEVF